jgi:tripartite ATP-independent transporter DctM subunit
MIEINPIVVTFLMLGGFFVLVMTGYPLAFAIGSTGLLMGILILGPNATIDLYYARVWSQSTNYILLAVPLFVFMGNLMEYSGMTEKLYDALYVWMGGVKGGLALVTMIIGIVIGGPVGIVAAAVSMLATVGLPAMVNRGYDKALAAGTVAAGGVLGILIPPSVMFIVYGPMAQISVGKMFFGALMPGFLLSALYLLYIFIKCWLQPELGPAIPESERAKVPFAKKTWMLVTSLVPPTILIIAVLGVMFFGIAAPTEAAAIGASATALIVLANRRFSFAVLKKCALETFKTSGFVFLIATLGFAFTGIFVGSGGGDVFAKAIAATPGGKWGAFGIIMFLFLALGFFIDWIAMIYILVPVAQQVAATFGFDPLWFAMMICINFQMEFMTPPLAMAIFIVYGVAPKELNISMSDCIRGIWPYVFLVIVTLFLCVAFPEIITWLPAKMIR